MLATIRDDTWNELNMQHITRNSKRWDYSDIPCGGHKKIYVPTHMVEGDHHLWEAPNPYPHVTTWMSNYIAHETTDVITYPSPQLIFVSKRGWWPQHRPWPHMHHISGDIHKATNNVHNGNHHVIVMPQLPVITCKYFIIDNHPGNKTPTKSRFKQTLLILW